jgi:uncharacterized protein (TIGR02001 family)
MRHALAAILALGVVYGPARVAADPFGAELGFATEYVFRGVSRSSEAVAAQGGAAYRPQWGGYIGVWGSSVNFPEGGSGEDGPPAELRPYLGYAGQVDSGWGWDARLQGFNYPDDDGLRDDYYELVLSGSYRPVELSVAYTDDALGQGGTGWYTAVELTGQPAKPTEVFARAGYSRFEETVFGADAPEQYADWQFGIRHRFAGFRFLYAMSDTDSDGHTLFGSSRANQRYWIRITRPFGAGLALP